MTTKIAIAGYTTYGGVRGQGRRHATAEAALLDLAADQKACRKQGGYSDRRVCAIGHDGRLYEMDGETVVWPSHGRSNGAVRAN